MDSHTRKRTLTLKIPGQEVEYILSKPKLRREQRLHSNNRSDLILFENKHNDTTPTLTPIMKLLHRYHNKNNK